MIEHSIIWDDPSSGRCWDRLAAYYRTEFEYEDGRQLRIKRACVYFCRHHTSSVYAFAGRTRGVLALKGVFGSEAEPLMKTSRKYKGSPLILAVSNKAKALLFYRFRIPMQRLLVSFGLKNPWILINQTGLLPCTSQKCLTKRIYHLKSIKPRFSLNKLNSTKPFQTANLKVRNNNY